MAGESLHVGRIAPLTAERDIDRTAGERFRQGGEARLLLFDRQQVDRVVRLRPDEAGNSAGRDMARLSDQRLHVERPILLVRRRQDGKRSADVRGRSRRDAPSRQTGKTENAEKLAVDHTRPLLEFIRPSIIANTAVQKRTRQDQKGQN